MGKKKDKASHILNTSATLLGICFIVLTSIHLNDIKETTIVDQLIAVSIVMFMISSILSFLSMRNTKKSSEKMEKTADIIFLTGLFSLLIITMLITLNIIK
ncbi:hypothetical protein [Flavobacterium yafengii]|uniref:hypothetical protein n=1 Tax=Flavobacterium yafengii TaxID=3041253 RepID=UPI0024A8F2A8|nr:hypothetical protein [Flavobacterium yafengii]MDI5886676.1 hypothetical protein [Flavobacterium yafengii]